VTSFPEANTTLFKENRSRRCGRGSRRGRGRGRNNVWRREGHNFKSNDNNVERYEKKRIHHLLKSLKVVVIDVV
jgi:hypothetical protein